MGDFRCVIGCSSVCPKDTPCWLRGNDDVVSLIEAESLRRSARMRDMLHEKGRPDLVADLDARLRDIDLGLAGARSTWAGLSITQRRALTDARDHGNRLERVGKQYRHRDRNQPYRPVYVATIRNLCARELLAWDGGAFDPEGAAMLTEHGRFVLRVANA